MFCKPDGPHNALCLPTVVASTLKKLPLTSIQCVFCVVGLSTAWDKSSPRIEFKYLYIKPVFHVLSFTQLCISQHKYQILVRSSWWLLYSQNWHSWMFLSRTQTFSLVVSWDDEHVPAVILKVPALTEIACPVLSWTRCSAVLRSFFICFLCVCFHSTNSGNTSDLFLMSPRTLDSLDSLIPGEPEASQGHLGQSLTLHTHSGCNGTPKSQFIMYLCTHQEIKRKITGIKWTDNKPPSSSNGKSNHPCCRVGSKVADHVQNWQAGIFTIK